jgi:hypothetical protein
VVISSNPKRMVQGMTNQMDLFASNDLPARKTQTKLTFGKHKNEPFEVLLQDPEYAMYLLSSMFNKLQHSHPELLAFLINRFGMPDRTPAHNLIQNRFLDNSFALRFGLVASDKIRRLRASLQAIDLPTAWRDHVHRTFGQCVSANVAELRINNGKYVFERLSKEKERLLSEAEHIVVFDDEGECTTGIVDQPVRVVGMEFEDKGADVRYAIISRCSIVARASGNHMDESLVAHWGGSADFRVEIKPLVGDDYPAILRTMKAVRSQQLLVGEFCGTTASWADVVKVFSLSGITAVLLSEVEREPIPSEFLSAAITPIEPAEAKAVIENQFAATEQRLRLP